jgi:short-subunit dehydrogenase
MSLKLKPLREQVMVITGASSGIGLATAKAAAKNGAKVVLVARDEGALADIEREITEAGGEAMHVVADVSDRHQLERVAQATIDRFGGFDTWVNNAGTSIFGELEKVSDEDHRRLFDINFWGVVYGSLIAVKHLKERGGGSLINLGSVASDIGLPIQGMYGATKHAIKGFTDSLRIELENEGAPIAVTLIKPTSIDTPFPQHAKNYGAREPKLPAPVYPPSEVAHAILQAATRGHRDVFVGGAAPIWSALHSLLPSVSDWLSQGMAAQEFRDEPARNPAGSLDRAGFGGRIRGEHPGYVHKTSLYTRAKLHPLMTASLVVAGMAAVGALLGGGMQRRDDWF